MSTKLELKGLGKIAISIRPDQLLFENDDDQVVGVELKNETILVAASLITDRVCKSNDGIGEATDRIYMAAFELIYKDPHQWSSRPCPTCNAITSLIKDPFGCVLYAEESNK